MSYLVITNGHIVGEYQTEAEADEAALAQRVRDHGLSDVYVTTYVR